MIVNIILFVIGIYNVLLGLVVESTGTNRFLGTFLFKFIPLTSGIFLVLYSAKLFGWL